MGTTPMPARKAFTTPRQRMAGAPASAQHGLFEQILQLAVDAAHLFLSPGFQLRPELGVDAQQECLAIAHRLTGPPRLPPHIKMISYCYGRNSNYIQIR